MERSLFTEEHRIFRDAFGRYLDCEVVPYYEKWEEDEIVPRAMWNKMGENGYLCPWIEEKYGGLAAGYEYSVIIMEELYYRRISGLLIPLHSDIIIRYIDSFGNEEQKMRWLPGCDKKAGDGC
jgi:acyl-CoA dehydrogenase